MATLISDKVTKRFGGLEALHSVELVVKHLSIQSIIGPNGAGKTTFFNCVTGFYIPEEGDILLDDRSVVGYSPDRVTHMGISRTYQNIRLLQEYDRRREHPCWDAPTSKNRDIWEYHS